MFTGYRPFSATSCPLEDRRKPITDKIETVDYGKFVHIVDDEGNKIELWEPNDIEYEKLGEQMGSKTTK